jgi:hypothetical protein
LRGGEKRRRSRVRLGINSPARRRRRAAASAATASLLLGYNPIGAAKKSANPRVKKLRSSAAPKMLRGIWKWRSPTWIK